MKNKDVILSNGEWYSKNDCPNYVKRPLVREGAHNFRDVSKKASKNKGEVLVTSQCNQCGAIIKDCPTFNIF